MSDVPETPTTTPDEAPPRRAYEAPQITAQASLEQVTLFSGTVADGGVIGPVD